MWWIMDPTKDKQIIPYKSKIAYELVFLEAIKDCRKQRVNDPGRAFLNSVKALELVLLPLEHKAVEKYKLDPAGHAEEFKKLDNDLSDIKDPELQRKNRINRTKKISWPLYCKELDGLYDSGTLEDQDFNGVADKSDLTIMKYEGLLEKIIAVLKENDWLIKGSDIIAGGGGHGLDGYEDSNSQDESQT